MPNIIDPIKVGNKISELLKANNMTQEKLANEIGISKSAVSQNLRGRSTFDIQNLIKISQIFKISLDELLEIKTQDDGGELSVYQKLEKQGLNAFDNLDIKELRLFEPDLYGKVFVEYLISENNLPVFKFLNEQDVVFVINSLSKAKDIYLKIIMFMLENELNPIKYLQLYADLNGSMKINDHLIEMKIWGGLNNINNKNFFDDIINSKINVSEKFLFIDRVKKISAITIFDLVDITSKYHLKNILLYLVNKISLEKSFDYFKMIEIFIKNQYLEGIIIYNDNYFVDQRENINKNQLQNSFYLIIEEKHVTAIENFLNLKLYSNLTKIVEKLIDNSYTSYVELIFKESSDNLNLNSIGKALIKSNQVELFSKLVNYFETTTLDYLMGELTSLQVEMLDLLVNNGARFKQRYQSYYTLELINNYLEYKGEK